MMTENTYNPEDKDKETDDNRIKEKKEPKKKGGTEEDEEGNSEKQPNHQSQIQFKPVLYNFRSPPVSSEKRYALQMPFALLFDNLITVLWSIYGQQEDKKILSGINQMQWALEFLKCLKEDYSYPESIRKIVNDLEIQLIDLYAKVGEQMKKNSQEPTKEEESKSNESEGSETTCLSFNEKDIGTKLEAVNIPLDSSGEPKALKELNSMGRRKPKQDMYNKEDNKSSKSYVIGALQKILNKTSEEGTKSDVEELIKGLKVQHNSNSTLARK